MTWNLAAAMPRRLTCSQAKRTFGGERLERAGDGVAVGAGIGKRSNQHVSGEAGERINVANHGNSSVGDGGWCGFGDGLGAPRSHF